MNLVKITFFSLFSLFFLSGCVHKSIYEPVKVQGSVKNISAMKKHLYNVVREGGMLTNGDIITKRSGLIHFEVAKGFSFINETKNAIIVANSDGGLKIYSKPNYKLMFSKKFDNAIVSATLKDNYLAAVLENNNILLYDIKADKVLYREALEKVITIDARAANPLFLNDLIIFPTLDGRLLIMQSDKKIVLRDVAISDKNLFNNVIFLKVNNNKLVASTASKVIVITPKNIFSYKAAIKDILYIDHKIYVFGKNGTVTLLDESLKKLDGRAFDFANFVAVGFVGNRIYMVEKQGYVISMDRDLKNIKVQKLDDEIEGSVLIAKGILYTDDKSIKLN